MDISQAFMCITVYPELELSVLFTPKTSRGFSNTTITDSISVRDVIDFFIFVSFCLPHWLCWHVFLWNSQHYCLSSTFCKQTRDNSQTDWHSVKGTCWHEEEGVGYSVLGVHSIMSSFIHVSSVDTQCGAKSKIRLQLGGGIFSTNDCFKLVDKNFL